jgi:hypothetical protein
MPADLDVVTLDEIRLRTQRPSSAICAVGFDERTVPSTAWASSGGREESQKADESLRPDTSIIEIVDSFIPTPA